MKYKKASATEIHESRLRYQNPYAHLDENDCFEAITSDKENEVTYIAATANQIRTSRLKFENQYAHLNENDSFDAIFKEQATEKTNNIIQFQRFLTKEDNRDASIEQIVHELHIKVWENKHQFFPEGTPIDAFKLLEPSIAIKLIGYVYDEANYLGTSDSNGSNKEIAGIINTIAKRIGVSRKLRNKEISRFTAAHELGHAVLHSNAITMHRDRSIDGSYKSNTPRSGIEIEADKFAAYYLMPRKLVREHFQQIFGVEVFQLTDDTAFALVQFNANDLITKCKTSRDLARVLAKAEQYNGYHMESLASRFGVSDEAMAIRIEELGLLGI